MATEGKYGEITAEKKEFHPGEPVFLLRATDPLAPLAIRLYYELCMAQCCDRAYIKAVAEHALRMADWQRANPTFVKDKPD